MCRVPALSPASDPPRLKAGIRPSSTPTGSSIAAYQLKRAWQRFFGVTAPVAHWTVLQLETHGLIRRKPGKARSLTLLATPEELPILR
jgi:hypothetical protein